MQAERYWIVLTGSVLSGRKPQQVAAELSGLFRMPEKEIRPLLGGYPSTIKRDLPLEKAQRLCRKIEERGAGCSLKRVYPELAVEDPPGLGQFESEDLDFDGAATMVLPSTAQGKLEQPPTAAVSDLSGARRRRAGWNRLPGIVAGCMLFVVVAWVIAILFPDYVLLASPQQPVRLSPAKNTTTITESGASITRRRQLSLSRAVRVWLIRHGSGFDPSQVGLALLQRDLGLDAQEIIDGWGMPMRYQSLGSGFVLRSSGVDRIFDTEDDLLQGGNTRLSAVAGK